MEIDFIALWQNNNKSLQKFKTRSLNEKDSKRQKHLSSDFYGQQSKSGMNCKMFCLQWHGRQLRRKKTTFCALNFRKGNLVAVILHRLQIARRRKPRMQVSLSADSRKFSPSEDLPLYTNI